jgi:hypothetical protein
MVKALQYQSSTRCRACLPQGGGEGARRAHLDGEQRPQLSGGAGRRALRKRRSLEEKLGRRLACLGRSSGSALNGGEAGAPTRSSVEELGRRHARQEGDGEAQEETGRCETG